MQRPKLTPVLPQWDLGIVLEGLSKPPYEPLREASLKHLTLNIVFLLAMASAGRRSKLQALVSDLPYIQLNLWDQAGVIVFYPTVHAKKSEA